MGTDKEELMSFPDWAAALWNACPSLRPVLTLWSEAAKLYVVHTRAISAFTWIEALVGLGVAAVLIALLVPTLLWNIGFPYKTATLSNLKQLQFATQAMVLDGEEQTNTLLVWPGNSEGAYAAWVHSLVPGYLGTNDFCKLSAAPGKNVPLSGKLPRTMRDGAVLVYAASRESPGETVFLSTANFTNTPSGGLPLASGSKPFGKGGFLVFRKEGSGTILKEDQVGQTNDVGLFAPLLRD